jgi:hypothetical protein
MVEHTIQNQAFKLRFFLQILPGDPEGTEGF